MNLCPDCGEPFKHVSRHWSLSDCTRPEVSQKQHEILTGLMMGDGSMSHRDRDRPAIEARMGNKEYLDFLHDHFKPMTTGVSEATETGGWETKVQMYRLRWAGRKEYDQYVQWYSSGQKRYPDELELTPTILKHWYVCDGSLNTRSVMRISTKNESDRKEFINELFKNEGFEVSRWGTKGNVIFHADIRDQLFEWMGDPLPGFEHKWPDGDT